MSNKPKVSERMFNLAECALRAARYWGHLPFNYMLLRDGPGEGNQFQQLFSAIAELEQRAGEIDFFASIVREHYADIVMPTVEDRTVAKPSDWINCAILELGNQHKRAEKWKEAAVAYQKWRDAYFKWEPDELVEHPQVHLDLEAAQDRLEAATAALGDEWDEAVKGEE